jgi:hypothetical protein
LRRAPFLVACLLAWLSVPVQAIVPETVVDVPTRGFTQRFLYLRPASPIANVILLTGFNGILRLRPDGTGETDLLESSAASRNRQRFADQGFAVAVVDAPSDLQVNGMAGYRQSTEHMTDLLAVIRYMRERADAPVWLVGHDYGAESAVFAALSFPPGQPVGIVPMAGRTPTSYLYTMPLRDVRRPVLMISHLLDPCSTYDNQVRAFDDLLAAPAKLHVTFSGGDGGTSLCVGSMYGYHQFNGLDAELVAAVADFVRKYNPLVTPPAATASAVEYYHAGFDHYFLTWIPDEIAKLDAGTAIQGWARTGRSLSVWRSAQPGSSPVCRFYIPPALGNSHFYGRGTAECDETAARNPSFVLEDAQFMHVVLPAAGVCPPGTVPVYRVFSNRADANHRYMTDRAVRDQMVASGWLAEGDGPDLVVMCAPE